MKALVNVVILQLILQLNFLKKDELNVYGVDFYYSGLHFPGMKESARFRYDRLLTANKFDHINDCLNMIDILLDQFDTLMNKPK